LVEPGFRSDTEVPFADERGDDRAVLADAAPLGLDEHPRLARGKRKREHPFADRRDGTVCIDGAEPREELLGCR